MSTYSSDYSRRFDKSMTRKSAVTRGGVGRNDKAESHSYMLSREKNMDFYINPLEESMKSQRKPRFSLN